MTTEPRVVTGTDDYRGATFTECDLRGLRVRGSQLDDVDLWAFGGELGSVHIEGVDVTSYVMAELDRHFPERVALRSLVTAEDHRRAWEDVRAGWSETLGRCEALPEARLHEQVNGEWSVAQTLRHLVFAVDLWLGGMVHEEAAPFHPLGLPPGDPTEEQAELDLTPDVAAPWAEVVELHRDRCRQVSETLTTLTDDTLVVERTRAPIRAWGEMTQSVGTCLWIIQKEHAEHRRYVERDLTALASMPPG
ncbi:DinB family protein [Nocardioides sp.]|uniref:DinB family protein n=1 Tax=Nocardioides sp. TaxID=35761 RepID=UPI00321A0981